MALRHSPQSPWSKVELVERGDQPERKKVAPVHGWRCRIWVQLWIRGMGGVAQCHQSMYWMLLFFAKHGTQDRCSKHALSLVCAAKKHRPAIHVAAVWNMHRTCIYRGSWVCCSVLRYASHWCWCWWMCHVTQSMHRICIEPRPHENSNVPFPSQSFLGGSYFGWIYIMISLLEWVWCDGMLHDSANQHNDKRRWWAGIAK